MFHSDKQMFCWLIELSNVSQPLTNVSSTTKRPDSQSNVSIISLSVITNANVTKLLSTVFNRKRRGLALVTNLQNEVQSFF